MYVCTLPCIVMSVRNVTNQCNFMLLLSKTCGVGWKRFSVCSKHIICLHTRRNVKNVRWWRHCCAAYAWCYGMPSPLPPFSKVARNVCIILAMAVLQSKRNAYLHNLFYTVSSGTLNSTIPYHSTTYFRQIIVFFGLDLSFWWKLVFLAQFCFF